MRRALWARRVGARAVPSGFERMFGHVDTCTQGDLGEASAIEWLVFVRLSRLASRGPLRRTATSSPGSTAGLPGVQVKTSRRLFNGRFQVMVCTKGGNQSWNGVVKRFSATRCDWLFVLVANGRRWFIPASEVGGGSSDHARRPEIRGVRGRPRSSVGCRLSPLTAKLDALAVGFPSGQRGWTVNPLAQPSQVRILPPPFTR